MIKLKEDKIKVDRPKYLFLDFESRVVNQLPDICKEKNCCLGRPHFNYVYAMDLTGEICIEIFDPIDVSDKFCTKVFSKEFQNYTFIAQYWKGYDFIGLLQWLEKKMS